MNLGLRKIEVSDGKASPLSKFSRLLLLVACVPVILLKSISALAYTQGAQTITLDGRLTDPAGTTALLDSSVVIDVKIYSPDATCMLYEEHQTVNTMQTDGRFTILVGSSTGAAKRVSTTGGDPGNPMVTIFSNQGLIAGSGCSYTPASGDARLLRVTVSPSSTGAVDVLSPDTVIDSVPFALVAETVQGLDRDHILAIDPTSTTFNQTTVANVFSGTNYPILNSLLAGTNTEYVRSSVNGAVIPSVSGTPVSTTTGQIWFNSSANAFQYYNGTAVQTLGVAGSGISSLNVGSSLTANGVASTAVQSGSTLDLVNSGVTASTYSKVTVNTKGLVTYGTGLAESDIPNLVTPGHVSGNAITSGTLGGSTSIYSSGNVTAQTVSSGVSITRQLQLFDPAAGSLHKIVFTAPTLASDYSLTYPATAGAAGYALTTDGSGNLSWSSVASNSLPSLASGKIWIGNSSGVATAVTPNGDINLSMAGSATVTQLQGAPVSASAPTVPGQILRWNGTAWTPNSVAMSDLRSTITGTSSLASCTSAQTLVFNSVTDSLLCSNISIATNQVSWSSTGANLVFAGPATGGVAAPSFRALTAADLPSGIASQWTTAGSTISYLLGAVGVGTATPQAQLDIYGTGLQSAMLVPRDGNSRPTGVNGMLRYNTSSNAMEAFANGAWSPLATGTSQWTTNGSNIYYGSGNVGIGTASPGQSLDVVGTTRVYSSTQYAGFAVSNGSNTVAQLQGTSASNDNGTLTLRNAGTITTSIQANGPSYLTGGYLGIGSTSPQTPIDVRAPVSLSLGQHPVAQLYSSTGASGVLAGYVSNGTAESGAFVRSVGYLPFYLGTTAQLQALTILDSNGNVGVGTSSPQALLDVYGTGVTSAMIVPRAATSNRPAAGVNGMIRYATDTNSLEAFTNGNWNNLTTAAGGSGSYLPLIGGTLTGVVAHPLGSAAAPSINFGDAMSGLFSTGSGNVSLSTYGTARISILPSGAIGFGTSSPSQMFSVIAPNSLSSGIHDLTGFGDSSNNLVATGWYGNGTGVSSVYVRSTNSQTLRLATTNTIGSGGITILDSGNIGVGTTSPTALLDVTTPASVTSGNHDIFRTSDGTNGLRTGFLANGSTVTASYLRADNSQNLYLATTATINTGAGLTLQNAGNVGIGTTSPQALLDVYGTGTTSAMIVPRATTANRPATGVAGMIRYNTDNAALELFNGTAWSNFTTAAGGSGAYLPLAGGTLTGAVTHPLGTVSAPAVNFGDSSSGLYSTGSGNISLATAGSPRISVSSIGYVGIGTTSPGATLEVEGGTVLNNLNAAITALAAKGSVTFDAGQTTQTAVNVYGRPSQTAPIFEVGATSSLAGNYLLVSGSGNVGIGTTNPTSTLTVAGSSNGAAIQATSYNNGNTAVFTNPSYGGGIRVDGATTTQTGLTISKAALNRWSLISSSTAESGSNVGSDFEIANYTDAGTAIGYPFLIQRSTGNVGVGTTSPNAPLHIYSGSASSLLFERNSAANANIQYKNTGGSFFAGLSPSGNFGIGVYQNLDTTPAFAVTTVGNIGVGTTAPQALLDVYGTGTTSAIIVPRASSASRPTGVAGMIRYNTDNAALEMFNGTVWSNLTTAAGGSGSYLPLAGGTLTGVVSHPLGSASAPSLNFGDSSTGLYATSSGNVSIATAGIVRLSVTSSGNIGIGTSSPTASLAINPNAPAAVNVSTTAIFGSPNTIGTAAGAYLYPVEFQSNAGNNLRLQFAPYRRIAGSSWNGTAYRLQYGVDGSFTDGSKAFVEIGGSDPSVAGGGFISLNTAGVDRLTVNNSGNVGVGTTAPSYNLDVAGYASFASAASANFNGSTSAIAAIANTGKLLIGRNYSAGQGETDFINNGNGGPGGFGFYNYSNAGTLTNYLTILSNGSVGVGTTAPSYPLHVYGTASSIVQTQTASTSPAQAGFSALNGNGVDNRIYTYGNVGYTGTISTSPLALVTGSGERMRIDTAGNVGVGTASPQALLDVYGTGTASAMIVPRATVANRPTANVNGMIRYATDTNALEAYVNGAWTNLSTAASGASQWATAGSNIYYGSGNVAIGTSAAVAQLTVSANTGTISSVPSGTILELANSNSLNTLINVDAFGTTIPILSFRKSDGSATSPSAIQSGDGLGQMQFTGFGATSYNSNSAAKVSAVAAETWTDSTMAGLLAFSTRPSNSTGTSVERMRIDQNGNVGIGTTAPLYLADLVSSSLGALRVASSQTTNGPRILLSSTGANGKSFQIISTQSSDGAGPGKLDFYDGSSGADRMVIDGSGNVGIGTSAPSMPLHVYSTGANGTTMAVFEGNASMSPAIEIKDGASTPNRWWLGEGAASVTDGTFFIYDRRQSVHRLDINSNGFIGIGTVAPAAALDINTLADFPLRLRASAYPGTFWRIGPFPSGSSNNFYIVDEGSQGMYLTKGSGATGWTANSDQRLKINIRPIDEQDGLDSILRLNPVFYNWKDVNTSKQTQEGFIAQEVSRVLPNLVSVGKDTEIHLENGSIEEIQSTLGINYTGLVVPLVKATQQLYQKWFDDSQKKDQEIEKLKVENLQLKQRDLEIRAYLCAKDPMAPFCTH